MNLTKAIQLIESVDVTSIQIRLNTPDNLVNEITIPSIKLAIDYLLENARLSLNEEGWSNK